VWPEFGRKSSYWSIGNLNKFVFYIDQFGHIVCSINHQGIRHG